MSTSHYGLSQVAGTDLVNFPTVNNADNVIIDTQMYANAQAAASADTKATNASSASASNATAITNLTNVVTQNGVDIAAIKTKTTGALTVNANYAQLSAVKDWLYSDILGQVHLHCNLYKATGYGANTYEYPAVLPSGFRPNKVILTEAMFSVESGSAGSESPVAGRCTIGTDGTINVLSPTTGKTCATIDIIFPMV